MSIGLGLGDPAHGSANAIRAALEGGIAAFDTAPNYGAGAAEQILGAVLSAASPLAGLAICTKAGYPRAHADLPVRLREDPKALAAAGHCLDPEFLDISFQGSLKRLGLRQVPELLLHNPEEQLEAFGTDIFNARLHDALGWLGEMRCQGKAARIGIACSQDVLALNAAHWLDTLCEAAARAGTEIALLQVPLSLSCTAALWPATGPSMLEEARQRGIGVIASAALGRMLLPPRTMTMLGATFGLDDPASVALQFVRSLPGVERAVFGSANPAHVAKLALLSHLPRADFAA